ncbi:MAG: ATP-dependent helicase [Candidatus Gastranaerophilales bacterium]|nr:ATP-dependent helicase [Candidatus Gastranaerophilales bacterium]
MEVVNAKTKSAQGPNEEQKKCIETNESKFLVIAGPGTGKTYTVSQRIKYLIEQKKINPERILCLTFSDTGAREMRDKAGKNYPINVFTFHSFCLNIIQNNIKDFEFNFDNVQIIQDYNKRNFINECIEEIHEVKRLTGYNNDVNNPYYFIKEIGSGIEEIERHRMKKEQFFYNLEHNPLWKPRLAELEKLIEQEKDEKVKEDYEKQYDYLEKSLQKMPELWDLYELYEEKKRQNGFIDYSDMIDMVLTKFEDKNCDLLQRVANSYDHILVDEYQDTNFSQNELVFNLAKYAKNIFVVGDDDQIIYRFQGAHIDTIENFIREFDLKAENISCLTQNYRSTDTILQVAMAMANLQNKFPTFKNRSDTKTENKTFPDLPLRLCSKDYFTNLKIDKKLRAANKELAPLNKPCEFSDEFPDRKTGINKIVNVITDIINPENTEYKTPEKLSEIAILVTKNDDLYEFEKYFKQKNIKVEFVKGKNIFNIETIIALINYMQFLYNPSEYFNKMFLYFLMEPFNINPDDYITLKEKCKKNTVIEDIEKILAEEKEILNEPEKFEEFIKTYKKLKEKYIEKNDCQNALTDIFISTGLQKSAAAQEYDSDIIMRGFNQLENEATCFFNMHKGKNSIENFVKYITNLMGSDIEIMTEKNETPSNAIQLSSYHSAKGREFEYVFMPELYAKKWENKNSSQIHQVSQRIPLDFSPNETYATIKSKIDSDNFLDLVKLLYVGITRAKHSLIFTNIKNRGYSKSWFMKKLEESLKGTELVKNIGNPPVTEPITIPTKYNYKDFEKAKLPTKFSPSALNTYIIKCPHQYFYSYILGIKNSEENPVYGDNSPYGTAVHETFRKIIEYAGKHHSYPETLQEVFDIFDKEVEKQNFNHLNEIKERGYKLFENYYEKFKELADPKTTDFTTEKDVEIKIPDETGEITFYGKIDRTDTEGGICTIYDYKTGTDPKEIERKKTKKHAIYYYQMAIYKYMLEQNGRNVAKTCFIYPEIQEENNKKDHLINNEIVIDDAEEIKNEYIEAVKKIRNFDFEIPAKKCPDNCNYQQYCKSFRIV